MHSLPTPALLLYFLIGCIQIVIVQHMNTPVACFLIFLIFPSWNKQRFSNKYIKLSQFFYLTTLASTKYRKEPIEFSVNHCSCSFDISIHKEHSVNPSSCLLIYIFPCRLFLPSVRSEEDMVHLVAGSSQSEVDNSNLVTPDPGK